MDSDGGSTGDAALLLIYIEFFVGRSVTRAGEYGGVLGLFTLFSFF